MSTALADPLSPSTVWLLTQGGPNNATNTLAVLAYETVFGGIPHVGPGVSVAFLATLVLIIVSVILYRQVRRATAV